MSVQRDPDAILAAWLEEGPNRLPEQTRRAISFTTRTTQQKRRPTWAPWRTPLMKPFAPAAVAAVAVIAVAGGVAFLLGPGQGFGGPAPTPSPIVTSAPSSAPPSQSPEAVATVPLDWTSYTSSRFAYTADYPTTWTVTPATADWPRIGLPQKGGMPMDVIEPYLSAPRLFVSSVPLNAGRSEAELTALFDNENAAFCDETSNRHSITVDGAEMRQEDQVCGGTAHVIEVLGVAGGRFYEINIVRDVSDGSPLTATDRAIFDRFLASLRFGAKSTTTSTSSRFAYTIACPAERPRHPMRPRRYRPT